MVCKDGNRIHLVSGCKLVHRGGLLDSAKPLEVLHYDDFVTGYRVNGSAVSVSDERSTCALDPARTKGMGFLRRRDMQRWATHIHELSTDAIGVMCESKSIDKLPVELFEIAAGGSRLQRLAAVKLRVTLIDSAAKRTKSLAGVAKLECSDSPHVSSGPEVREVIRRQYRRDGTTSDASRLSFDVTPVETDL